MAFNDTVQDRLWPHALDRRQALRRAFAVAVPEGRTRRCHAASIGSRAPAASQGAHRHQRWRRQREQACWGGARARASNHHHLHDRPLRRRGSRQNPGVLKSLAQTTDALPPDSSTRVLQACEHIAREIRAATDRLHAADRDGAFHQRARGRGGARRPARLGAHAALRGAGRWHADESVMLWLQARARSRPRAMVRHHARQRAAPAMPVPPPAAATHRRVARRARRRAASTLLSLRRDRAWITRLKEAPRHLTARRLKAPAMRPSSAARATSRTRRFR